MKTNTFGKTLKTNIVFAYSAQLISMFISIFFTLIIPKILGVEGFGYWQLLALYVNYLGIFYLGLNDGLYLRIGGIKRDELINYKVKEQTSFFFIIHIIISVLLILLSLLIIDDFNRRFIIILTLIYLPFFNLKGVLDQTFQAINLVKTHSVSVILEKVVILLSIIILFLLGYRDFKIFTVFYILSGITATAYILLKSRLVITGNKLTLFDTILESKTNIRIGIPLMLSSFASLLILSTSKQIIDARWGISDFGIVALSISMVSLFLVFINKSGLVLFPSLRSISSLKQKLWYENIKQIMDIILPLIFLSYIPICLVIEFWLPDYIESIKYIGVLLPLVIFEGKMGVLGTTYFKVLRLEKRLFVMNILILVFNIVFGLIAAYYFNSVLLLLVILVFSLTIRAVFADLILNKYFELTKQYKIFVLVGISTVFITLHFFINMYYSFVIYTLFIVVYVVYNWQQITIAYINIKNINSSEIL